jgi:hypothetical protein
VVELTALRPLVEQYILAEEYPVASTPPDVPNLICQKLDPFVLTPLNITVIRFTQFGIDVKSIDVPDVEATAVPDCKPLYTAPLFVVTPAEPSIVTAIIYPLMLL